MTERIADDYQAIRACMAKLAGECRRASVVIGTLGEATCTCLRWVDGHGDVITTSTLGCPVHGGPDPATGTCEP